MDPIAEARLLLEIVDQDQHQPVTWIRTPRASARSAPPTQISSDSGIKESKVPVFSGQAEHFPIWWAKFKAYGKINGFSKCLKNAAEATLPGSAEEDANDTNDQKAAHKRNDDAVLAFTLDFNTNMMMATVLESAWVSHETAPCS